MVGSIFNTEKRFDLDLNCDTEKLNSVLILILKRKLTKKC